jgi:hypothetical protein
MPAFLTTLIAAAGLCAIGAEPPTGMTAPAPGAALFTGGQVLRLRIELGPDQSAQLRREPREYVRATLREGRQRFSQVGVHLKGATGSFRGLDDKPSFTLSFDRFDPSQRFHGLRKIHLNNSVEDLSYLNDLLGSELFRAVGVPAARTAHALVELDGRALGLYVLKEGFTEDFLALHFAGAGSRLYEPGPGHDVNEPLDEKAGPGTPDRVALDALSAAALEPDPRQRWPRLQATLDVERFLSFMALEVMLAHRDGYCLARNNFRVCHAPATGRTVFLPHGMDQLFGSSPALIEPRMNGLIARAVLETPEGREAYRRRFGFLLTNVFDPPALHRRIDAVSPALRKALPAGQARALKQAVEELKVRIAERRAHVQRQFAQPELQPLQFQGGVATLSGWRPFDQPAGGAMQQVRSGDGRTELHIRAGRRTAASWRTTVRLAPGRYRFEGTVRTEGIEPMDFGKLHGAALRVWQPMHARSEPAPATSPGTLLRVEFDVPTNGDVELACELRARAGAAWFDAASLRLVRVTGGK